MPANWALPTRNAAAGTAEQFLLTHKEVLRISCSMEFATPSRGLLQIARRFGL
jgi:hypothetical protein